MTFPNISALIHQYLFKVIYPTGKTSASKTTTVHPRRSPRLAKKAKVNYAE